MIIVGDGIMLGVGGESASILVTAPTGSTVTCATPKGIVLTATEVNGTWTFDRLKVYGIYTIMATNGTSIKTQDVAVDSAIEYSIEMDYKLWLYKDGVSYDFNNFHLYGVPSAYGHNFSVAGKITTQKIDLSKYNKICWTSSVSSYRGVAYFLTDINIDNAFNSQSYMGSKNQTSGEKSLEGINDTVYVVVGGHQGWSVDDMSVSDYSTYYAVINSRSSSYNSYYSRVWLE